MKKKILGITLARGGSKGIKDKNIVKINNKPLIQYTIDEALKSKLLTHYIISTDSKKIKEVSLKIGAQVPFIRPKKLSTDSSSSVAALQHAVNFMENLNKIKYDYVIEIMCTNPLKKCNDINSIIKKIIRTKADTVIAVHQLEDHHPRRIKKIVKDKIVDFCLKEKKESRRQDLQPNAYIRSGSIYAIKRDYLMKKNARYGSKNSRPYILPQDKALNIDTKIDLLIAKQVLKDK